MVGVLAVLEIVFLSTLVPFINKALGPKRMASHRHLRQSRHTLRGLGMCTASPPPPPHNSALCFIRCLAYLRYLYLRSSQSISLSLFPGVRENPHWETLSQGTCVFTGRTTRGRSSPYACAPCLLTGPPTSTGRPQLARVVQAKA